MQVRIKRLFNLISAIALQDAMVIFYYHFILNRLAIKAPHLHRLLVFSIACADNGIEITGFTNNLILLSWAEGNAKLKLLVRRYTRDLMVFSEIFLESGYLSYIKKVETNSWNAKFIIDAGANIGCSAIYLHIYFPDATIVCLEPESSNFELLLQNIRINNASAKIFCIKKAIWNETTKLDLMQRDWSSDAFHVMHKENPDEVVSTTETITFSRLMEDFRYDKIDLLKLDVEGAEKVFFEDEQQLKQFLPCTKHLVMEVHEEFIEGKKICDQLDRFDFRFKLEPIGGDSSLIIADKN